MIVAVDQTGIDTAVLILGVAMVNSSQVDGLDSWSKSVWILLALTSKMAGDIIFVPYEVKKTQFVNIVRKELSRMKMKKVSYCFSTIVLLGCVSDYFERNPVLSGGLNRESNYKLF